MVWEQYWWLLFFLMPFAAFLYAAVGHGGASSYLMFLALFGFAPEQIRPTALMLNMVVSLIAFTAYRRKVQFPKNLFFWLILFSMPAAYIGGTILVDTDLYKRILGILLIFPILKFLNVFPVSEEKEIERKWWMVPLLGLSIGFFSGLIGIGGGIILSPILLMLGWTNMKETAALSALFIFFNSIAGFLGTDAWNIQIDQKLWVLMPLTILGGILGAYLGANRFKVLTIQYVLVAVLCFAAAKLIIG